MKYKGIAAITWDFDFDGDYLAATSVARAFLESLLLPNDNFVWLEGQLRPPSEDKIAIKISVHPKSIKLKTEKLSDSLKGEKKFLSDAIFDVNEVLKSLVNGRESFYNVTVAVGGVASSCHKIYGNLGEP